MALDQLGAERRLSFGPAPATFPLTAFDPGDRDTRAMGDRGVCFWLSDSLVDTTGPERVHSSRLIQQVTGSEGLQRAASVEILFNPHHERVVVHRVRVMRDGTARDVATPEAFEMFRRELNLERAIYDGRVTAHMLIPDVRIGDVIDVSYSVHGANPVLRDALSPFFSLQWASPTLETRCRVRTPRDRKLTITSYAACPTPTEDIVGGVRELAWRVVDAETYRHEADAPASHIGYAAVRVTDEMDWADVSDLFRPSYAPPARLPEDLAAEIDALGQTWTTPAERTAEGLRFVQRSLRYHSISVGEGGYRPRDIEAIWATRYGDCKDASRLLTAVLDRLGVSACPALVNTWIGDGLGVMPPNPTAFDHCIVRAVVDGQVWWLDPTCSVQSGDLEHLVPSHHHRALPLTADATLETMGNRPVVLLLDAQEEWTFARAIGEPAQLAIITDYRGWRADDMRRWRDNGGLSQVARQMRESLENQYGALVETRPLEWIDDPRENRLQLVETYSVERPFNSTDSAEFVRFDSRDDIILPTLRTAESPRRTEPIGLGGPGRWRVRSTYHFPVTVQIAPWSEVATGPGVWGKSAFSWPENRTGHLDIELEIRAPVVAASDAQSYFAFKRRMVSMNGLSLILPVENGRLKPQATGRVGWRSWAVTGVLIVLFVAARLVAG